MGSRVGLGNTMGVLESDHGDILNLEGLPPATREAIWESRSVSGELNRIH